MNQDFMVAVGSTYVVDDQARDGTRLTDKAFVLPLSPLEMALAFPDENGRKLLEPYMRKARERTAKLLDALRRDDRELDLDVLFEVMLEREISDAQHAERLTNALAEIARNAG